MTDLDRISLIEKTFGFKLNHVPIEKLATENIFYTNVLANVSSNVINSDDFYYNGTRNYSTDQNGNIIGLSLDFCPVYRLPLNMLTGFGNLSHLRLKNVYLSDVSFLGELKGLTSLDLSNNSLSDVSFLGELIGLTSLDLSNNSLSDVSFLGQLIGLTSLYFRNNNLSDVSFLGELIGLTSLDLTNNNLSDVSFLGELKGLTFLCLKKNPEIALPKEIIENDNCAREVIDYFKSLKKGEVTNTLVKLIITGNTTVGKTSLVKALTGKDFDEKEITTHGINLQQWLPKNGDLQVNIWDFGGQEYYHATHNLFFSNDTLYLLVWDKEHNSSRFINTTINLIKNGAVVTEDVNLECFDYTYWMDNLRFYTEESPVLLVQNKVDNGNFKQLPENNFLRKYKIPDYWVYHISSKKASEDNNSHFFTDFKKLKDDLLIELRKTASTFKLGKYWAQIRDAIIEKSKEIKKIWTYQEYFNFCKRIDNDIESELGTLNDYLHNTGVILWYKNIDQLKDKVFIDPPNVANTIYEILNDTAKNNKGKFNREHVLSVLNDDDDITDTYIELMKAPNFALVFKDPHSDDYLAPQYLDDSMDEGTLYKLTNKLSSIAFRLSYPNFLPKNVMVRFISIYGINIKQSGCWKYGIVFEKGNVEVFVNCEFEKRLITVRTAKYNRRSLIIREVFDKLGEISNYDLIELAVKDDIDDAEFVTLKSLKAYNKLKWPDTIPCPPKNSNDLISIDATGFQFFFCEPNKIDVKPDFNYYYNRRISDGCKDVFKYLVLTTLNNNEISGRLGGRRQYNEDYVKQRAKEIYKSFEIPENLTRKRDKLVEIVKKLDGFADWQNKENIKLIEEGIS